jgi:hypothetical protein
MVDGYIAAYIRILSGRVRLDVVPSGEEALAG